MATEKNEKVEKETKAEQQPEVKGTKPNLKDGLVFELKREKADGSEYWNYYIEVCDDKGRPRGRVKPTTKDEDRKQFYDLLDTMCDEAKERGRPVNFMVRNVEVKADKATGRKASEYTEYSVFTVDDYGEIDSVGVSVPGKANKSLLDRLIRQALRG